MDASSVHTRKRMHHCGPHALSSMGQGDSRRLAVWFQAKLLSFYTPSTKNTGPASRDTASSSQETGKTCLDRLESLSHRAL